MQIVKFNEIKEKLGINDDDVFIYTLEQNGSLKLVKLNEYEVLAEEGLRDVYDDEPLGLWEQCIES